MNAVLRDFLNAREHRAFLASAVQILRERHAGQLTEIRARVAGIAGSGKDRRARSLVKLVLVFADAPPPAAGAGTDGLHEEASRKALSLLEDVCGPPGGHNPGEAALARRRAWQASLRAVELKVSHARRGKPLPPSYEVVWRPGYVAIDGAPTTFSPEEAALVLKGASLADDKTRVAACWLAGRAWAVEVEDGEALGAGPKRKVLYLAPDGAGRWRLLEEWWVVPAASALSRPLSPQVRAGTACASERGAVAEQRPAGLAGGGLRAATR